MVAAGRDDAADESDVAQPFSERAERELANVKKIITEIDFFAHQGQDSEDPAMALAVIEPLAADGERELYGRFWDELTAALKRADSATS